MMTDVQINIPMHYFYLTGSLEKNLPVAQFLQNDIMLLVLWPSSLTRRIKLVFQGAMQCKAVPGEQPSKLTMSEIQHSKCISLRIMHCWKCFEVIT